MSYASWKSSDERSQVIDRNDEHVRRSHDDEDKDDDDEGWRVVACTAGHPDSLYFALATDDHLCFDHFDVLMWF